VGSLYIIKTTCYVKKKNCILKFYKKKKSLNRTQQPLKKSDTLIMNSEMLNSSKLIS